MHFYTYDEWVSNSYYSVDTREITPSRTQMYDLTENTDKDYLIVRSCWRNPEFVSSYSQSPSIVPTMSTIDCDIGCLYQLRDPTDSSIDKYSNEGKILYRSRRGVIQEIGNSNGSFSSIPYIVRNSVIRFDDFTQQNKKSVCINIGAHRRSNVFDRILIFQSVYSGAISFEEMNSNLEFYFSDSNDNSSTYKKFDYKINTNMNSSDSLMIVGALLTFDNFGTDQLRSYLTIESVCKFVYGHVDMDNEYEVNNLWSCFQHPASSRPLESSIMHYTKS